MKKIVSLVLVLVSCLFVLSACSAGNTLVVDREKTIAMSDEHNITILVK